ncbi:MAG: hypothetical protein EBT04_09265 [Betaproteobacteria bacterium]|nr:hypothetical protein [Betaproteobacteria bacterium]
MKPFLDPFPFRNPEARSSIGDVIAEIVNGKSPVTEGTEGDLHGDGATSPPRRKRKTPAPVVYTPTTPRVTEPLKVSEGCGDCTTDAIKSLKAANTADLQDAPGAAGEKAHKRLHKTIGKVLKGTK